jgi:hypothetical protein
MTSGLTGLPALTGLGGMLAPGAELLTSYTSRVAAAGGTITGVRLSALSTLLDTRVVSGVASRIDYATLPGAPDAFAGSVVPLIDTFGVGNCTTNYVPGEWSGQGFKGTGKNLTSPYAPATHGNADDAHLSVYYSENKSAGVITVLGCQDGGGALQMYANTFLVSNICSDGGDRTVEFTSPTAGLSMGSRRSSTLHELRTPTGGGADKLANTSTNTRAGTMPATNFVMIHPTVPNRILFSSVGKGMTGPQYTILANALATYTATRGA